MTFIAHTAPGACTEGALRVLQLLQGSWYFPTADLDHGKSPSYEFPGLSKMSGISAVIFQLGPGC